MVLRGSRNVVEVVTLRRVTGHTRKRNLIFEVGLSLVHK